MKTIKERALGYISKLPLAVSGQRGHDTTFRVACCLVHGFGLPESDALELLQEYNAKLSEQWTDHELLHKIQDAGKASHQQPRGYLVRSRGPYKPVKATRTTPAVVWKINRREPPLPSPSPPALRPPAPPARSNPSSNLHRRQIRYETQETIWELHGLGESIGSLAEQCGVAPESITQIFKEFSTQNQPEGTT